MTIYDYPADFEGTPDEAAANHATHLWIVYGDETECDRCCAKPWHRAASYPCGVTPPRVVVCIECRRGIAHTHDERTTAILEQARADGTLLLPQVRGTI